MADDPTMTDTFKLPPRLPIVGTLISAVSVDELLATIEQRPTDRAVTVAFCNVHSVMTARTDPLVRSALEQMDVAAPDGMPVVWGLRASGVKQQHRVDGPSFLVEALQHGVRRGWRHFFYGSTDATLRQIEEAAAEVAPGAVIAGTLAPPFGPLSDADLRSHAGEIRSASPDLVWVGLGMPKQEIWMHRSRGLLPGIAVLGVGAAFDFLAGTQPRAPGWMQSSGLEWLHRFAQEPRRLWRRYLLNNPAYLGLLATQIVRSRLGPSVGRRR